MKKILILVLCLFTQLTYAQLPPNSYAEDFTLTDIYGNEYIVQDITAFKEHIIMYHTNNGKPDGSIHEENGYYFRVDDKFLKTIKNL